MIEPADWYRNVYRRNVIDMHITADDDRFLSNFDPKTYVEMLVKAQVQSTVLYAQSHVGFTYFPTKIGKMHPGLHDRNIFGEVASLCRQAGIYVVAYFSLIFDHWAYHAHPDWKICDAEGKPSAEDSRYGVCCPNSPYREYVRAIIEELCTNSDFDGIRFDMTFWPRVCYCHYCQERFADEVGGELPRVIDWDDPKWVAFQRARERWLVEFAELATSIARRFKPGVSVEHQASTYPHSWRMGVTTALAQHNDFLQGDFYGDALQGSFVRKLLYNLSPKKPVGFETSISTDLTNPTALKSEILLKCKAAAALTDGAAFIMIDSIDPVGTLNPMVYERMGRVFEQMKPYQSYLGGEPVQDIAIYFSTESKYDPADNGRDIEDPHTSGKMPHMEAVLGACKALLDRHIPFGVITRQNLETLSCYKTVILPNVLMMDSTEAEALREYVRGGGHLYASRNTSLQSVDGKRQIDFLLADVFGVSYQGETKEKFTYIAPTSGYEKLFGNYSKKYPVGFYAPQLQVKAYAGVETLGELVLPYTDPADLHHFASTHNNPPGRWTGNPSVVLNHYGKGLCLYTAMDFESPENARGVFTHLVELLAAPFSFETDAPNVVEISVFQQPENRRYIVNLVNFQKELPNIPVEGIHVRIQINGKIPRNVYLLPDEESLEFQVEDGWVRFTISRLETYCMLAVVY